MFTSEILIGVAVMGVLYALANYGVLTHAQVEAMMALIGVGGAAAARRMAPPRGNKPPGDPPKPKHRTMGVIVFGLLLGGCTATFDEAHLAGANDHKLGAPEGSPERCADLSDAQDTWSFLGKLGGGLGTAGALAPVHEGIREDDVGRWVSLGTAAGGALLAGVGVHMADLKGAAYVREGCGR